MSLVRGEKLLVLEMDAFVAVLICYERDGKDNALEYTVESHIKRREAQLESQFYRVRTPSAFSGDSAALRNSVLQSALGRFIEYADKLGGRAAGIAVRRLLDVREDPSKANGYLREPESLIALEARDPGFVRALLGSTECLSFAPKLRDIEQAAKSVEFWEGSPAD